MTIQIWPSVGSVESATDPNAIGFASRLRRLFQHLLRRPRRAADLHRWRAIDDVLRYAADAERRVAELNRQVKHLEELSERDPLTGVANRRGLVKFLDTLLASAERYDEFGILIFVDLDNFKNVNDSHGHDAGDQVLKGVAEVLRQHTRRSDFVARLGGDEFVIVLPRTDPSTARDCTDKFQNALEDTVFSCEHLGLSVRASFGAVAYGPYSDRDDLLSRADRAMYLQKRIRSASTKELGGPNLVMTLDENRPPAD